ncbi:MAG: hypothetical protein COA78_21550 [Blastopirellula sp.]|nr:MAG: hypothetical protein COA78_21550 [Blastopirellula sp.]
MNNPEPSIRVKVDLTNPGQFFACCGLLELADRLWPGAEGWFEEGEFLLHVSGQSQESVNERFMEVFRKTTFKATDENDSASPIIINLAGICELRIDWWSKVVFTPSLRTWGRGTSYSLLSSLCSESVNSGDLNSGFSFAAKMTGRLSVDPRSSWTAQGAGFSPNDQSFTVATFPLVEFLAGIGLQRIRPSFLKKRWYYTTWNSPLPSQLIPAAGQMLSSAKTTFYSFELAQRGLMNRYFTYALEGK